MTPPRTVVLVDGEHYPPVTMDGIAEARARGYDVVAAAMLGGIEKLKGELDLGLPIVSAETQLRTVLEAIDRYDPTVVLDLSDAPVVDLRARALLSGAALSRGVAYHAADLRYDVPDRPRLSDIDTIAVIGTGKRTGKTAVAAALARHATAAGRRVAIVAMGRGGPSEPVVVRGDLLAPTPASLLEIADRGDHAASDVYEDAVMARVIAVGARRAGAGPAGGPFAHTVHEAVRAAVEQGPDLLILEGSGTAIPPAAAGATLLVVGAGTPAAELLYGFGPYRLLIADLAVVTMSEEPVLSTETISALTSSISELTRDVPIVRTVFRPTPVEQVRGRRVFLATTAPEAAGDGLATHLEEVHGARVVGMSHALSDRTVLTRDLAEAEGTYEVLLTEVKAAAIDVATRSALAAGARVVFCDNEPLAIDGDLASAFDELIAKASKG